MNEDHHKLRTVTLKRNIWLREIATAEPSGKSMRRKLGANEGFPQYLKQVQATSIMLSVKLNRILYIVPVPSRLSASRQMFAHHLSRSHIIAP